MASEVGICNLALSHLGDRATVSSLDPPEGSAQAEHCARFYPQARDTILEMHAWGFATKRVALADISLVALVPSPWTYAYRVPADSLRVISVLEPEASNDAESQPFEMELGADGSTVLYSNVEDAVCRYTARVTDPNKFSPLFVDALSWLLSSMLAGPVLKGQTGMNAAQTCYQKYLQAFFLAARSDANQRKNEPPHTAPWISAR